MAELTEDMKLYCELDREKKVIEEKHKALRLKILKDFQANPFEDYEGITYKTYPKVTLVDSEFYSWVAKDFPDHLKELIDEKINYEKFEALTARGLIKYDELPDNVYKKIEIETVTVHTRPKKAGIKKKGVRIGK